MTTRTVAVSDTTAERLRSWGVPGGRIVVVENGIDFEALVPAEDDRRAVRDDLGIAEDVTAIAVVGRLDPVKRVDEVLQALAPRLAAGGHVLVVAGAGPLLAPLQELAASLGVADAVRWLGPRPDVPRVLAAADVLVSASRDETFGMAIVEAVGSGLPVVYAQCPALEEIAPLPGAIVAVPGGGAAALQRALDELLTSGLTRQPVPDAVRQRYGAARTAEAIDALYARLIHGGEPVTA